MTKTLSTRLKNELKELTVTYELLSIENKGTHEYELLIKERNIESNVIYKFVIDITYPFKPPTIYVDNNPYIHFLNLQSARFNSVLKYLKGVNCLCCHSFSCANNWTPAYKLLTIIKEIKEYKKIKYDIATKLIMDKIKDKYLIKDIDLDSWLFDIACPFTNII